ncbi:MAG TPA: hypothetical protein VFE24_16110 [Pirellulales bacterium]|jgi:epidermal growth factor receptor substrate 15|nr:hypothetical protein [Pirellulales bacterium]
MARSEVEAQAKSAAEQSFGGIAAEGANPTGKRSEIRVDAAHALATESAQAERAAQPESAARDSSKMEPGASDRPVAPPRTAEDDEAPVRLIQHVRRQAEQLAQHLRSQQRELDQREAFLNAREAQIEQQMRSARLWLHERQTELRDRQSNFEMDHRRLEADRLGLQSQLDALQNEQQGLDAAHRGLEKERVTWKRGSTTDRQTLASRQAELDKQRHDLQHKQEGWRAAQEQFTQRQQALEALQQMLIQRETELQRREKELAAQANNSHAAAAVRAATEYQARQQQLDEAETLLTAALNDLELNRQTISADRLRAEQQTRSERRKITETQRLAELDLQRKKELIQRRSEQLDTRQVALEQMRADLTRLHRETLEMRLAVEETWAQLSGMAAPSVVTQTLGRLRSRLADRYRLELEEVAAQREGIETLGNRLTEQHEKLGQQKRDFQQWAARQRDEFEQQTARLAAREKEVEQGVQRCEDLQTKWNAERRHYQQEIRRLLADLRQGKPEPASTF